MVEEQGGVCILCGGASPDRALAVDHDHASGSIRGLLCSTCNTGLGAFGDDPELLRRAIAYLDAHARDLDPKAQPSLSAKERTQLAFAFELLIAEFANDIELLSDGRDFDDTLMSTHLPRPFAERYDLGFAIRFLLATARLEERFRDGVAYPANCVGEELAMRAVVSTAVADAAIDDPATARRLDEFGEGIVPDRDVELLFGSELVLTREQAGFLGVSHLWYEDWFRPFSAAPPGERSALN
jgi:hypothetical protein